MSEVLAVAAAPIARLRDLVELAKPRITGMVVLTTALGLSLAPEPVGTARGIAVLVATGLLVASAQGLNSFLERDVDARMHRTRNRPIPAGRIDPWSALGLALGTAACALPMLALVGNRLTAGLGLAAWVLYVAAYTPLKRVTPWALEVGGIPGALPPLMGWTAATGSLSAPGWALFGLLFFWQLPHFLAISLSLRDDYARGGLRVLPLVAGVDAARRRQLLYAALLLGVSLLPWALGMAGIAYLAVAVASGVTFAALVAARADRRAFLFSIAHLTVLVAALLLDAR